jgi:hypothetical protein
MTLRGKSTIMGRMAWFVSAAEVDLARHIYGYAQVPARDPGHLPALLSTLTAVADHLDGPPPPPTGRAPRPAGRAMHRPKGPSATPSSRPCASPITGSIGLGGRLRRKYRSQGRRGVVSSPPPSRGHTCRPSWTEARRELCASRAQPRPTGSWPRVQRRTILPPGVYFALLYWPSPCSLDNAPPATL